jgi:ubiquinone/menaquinone biosynthesis C-methylase UbiE
MRKGTTRRSVMIAILARSIASSHIHDFAQFLDGRGKVVLEIGVGMGADHLEWARSYLRRLAGVDLTLRAVGWTAERLETSWFTSELEEAEAERLPFPDNSFDIVYS